MKPLATPVIAGIISSLLHILIVTTDPLDRIKINSGVPLFFRETVPL